MKFKKKNCSAKIYIKQKDSKIYEQFTDFSLKKLDIFYRSKYY